MGRAEAGDPTPHGGWPLTNQPDPLRQEIDAAWSNYQLLAARVAPGKGAAGRRVPPASRPPLDMAMVSAMAELEQYLQWWNSQARHLLQPVTTVELTARTGVRCPHCGADLVAWIHAADQARSEIRCTNLTPHYDSPNRWLEPEWKRLGVLAGVHDDGRFTTIRADEQRPA